MPSIAAAIIAVLLIASSCGASDSAQNAATTTTTEAAAPTTTEPPTTTEAAVPTTTTPSDTTTTEPSGCADPPRCSYGEGQDICTVDSRCAGDPDDVYVNETIGFSFTIDPDWRRLETDDGSVLLVNRYFGPEDPYITISWEPTMGRTIDMFYNDLVASSDGSTVSVWDWSGPDTSYVRELDGALALNWESELGLYPQRFIRAIHPDPYAKQSVVIESFGSCLEFCPPEFPNDQWDQVVGLISNSFDWAEPAAADAAECLGLGGGRYEVNFPAGEFGTTVSCALVRGDQYLFRVAVAAGQTLTASVTSLESNAVFALVSPSGQVLATDQTELVVPETEAGTYEFEVGSTRGNSSFDLSLDVR